MLFWILLFSVFIVCNCERHDCHTSCGPLNNITYPLRLNQDPKTCGKPGTEYEIACENDSQPLIYLNSRSYHVKSISYGSWTIRVIDSALHSHNCSSLPPPHASDFPESGIFFPTGSTIVFVNCSVPIEGNLHYIPTSPCIGNFSSFSTNGSHLYAMLGERMDLQDLDTSCMVVNKVYAAKFWELDSYPTNYSDIHNIMMGGFDLMWRTDLCEDDCWGEYRECDASDFLHMRDSCSNCTRWFQSRHCFVTNMKLYLKGIFTGMLFLGRTMIGLLCLSVFLIYKLRRKKIWLDSTVEEFLSNYKYQMPRRYSYSDVKKITKNFKEKLGQGGFGSVFRGKLSTGRHVAVKMLNKSKGNGQDYINEISTIGRIHHVNVIRLVGFCSEGSKRALIYDFMPNGSLEKNIFMEGKDDSLSWDKMYQIALGIAHGIHYLHQGCDMRILHFDIKPHNILLDENFIPKVSDFGLAKFYSTKESIVSITAARGTIGYIAPELLYKNLGEVSYKSDVYSFGMLLMEMAARRRNIDAFTENSSRVYFPSWIYDQLDQRGELAMEEIAHHDKEIAKKLIIVALWCIQVKPIARPSMSTVIEMMEGNVQDLRMPPKPGLSFPPRVSESCESMKTLVD